MRRIAAAGLLVCIGCGPAAEPGEMPAPAERPAGGDAEPGHLLVPAGFGTLRQDDFTVALRSDALLIKVTPLAEEVIRLAAPDTYGRLRALAASRRAEAEASAGLDAAELFFVSFFSYQPDVPFQPEDLQLVHQGRQLRPRAIVPLAPGWGRQRLQQQETQAAVYGFEPGIDYMQPLVVQYGMERSSEWTRIIPRLEVERAKVQSRAGT